MKDETKHNIRFFLVGLLVLTLIEVAWNWQDAVRGFKDGFGITKSK